MKPFENGPVGNALFYTRVPALDAGHLSAESYQVDVNRLPDVLLILSGDGVIQYANVASEAMLGYNLHELFGQLYDAFVFADDRDKAKAFAETVKATSSVANAVHRVLKKDGSVRHISWSAVWLETEKVVLATGHDVSEMQEAQQKQLATEQLLQALIDNSFDLLALIDENGKYLYVSESVYQTLDFKIDPLLGYKASELVGTTCFDYMHPDDLPWLTAQFRLLFQGEKMIQVPPYRFRDAAGMWHWIEAIVTNQLSNPNINAIVVSARDITPQIDTEKRLKELQLLEALMEGEEKERSRIARDLHDEVSGMLAAAKMHFTSLSGKLLNASAYKEFEQGIALLEHAALQVRRTSHNLMPEVLLENGLNEALARYCSSISNDRLRLNYISIGHIGRYTTNFELSLYRIAQELIGNIIKHANATQAFVQLSAHQNIVSLNIEDNGQGFVAGTMQQGTGLTSVKKRVDAMGGHMDVRTRPGHGTTIYLQFEPMPYHPVG